MSVVKLKQNFLVFFVLALISISPHEILADDNIGKDYGIDSIKLEPENLVSGENYTLAIQFFDQADISFLTLFMFQIYPSFKNETSPINMENIPGYIRCPNCPRFGGNFTANYNQGATLGFQFQITYDNLTSIMLPDSLNVVIRNPQFCSEFTIENYKNEDMLLFVLERIDERFYTIVFTFSVILVLVISASIYLSIKLTGKKKRKSVRKINLSS